MLRSISLRQTQARSRASSTRAGLIEKIRGSCTAEGLACRLIRELSLSRSSMIRLRWSQLLGIHLSKEQANEQNEQCKTPAIGAGQIQTAARAQDGRRDGQADGARSL